MSNNGLNSNAALEESTATSASVMLSGIRRLKEKRGALDIQDYTTIPGNSDGRRGVERRLGGRCNKVHSVRSNEKEICLDGIGPLLVMPTRKRWNEIWVVCKVADLH